MLQNFHVFLAALKALSDASDSATQASAAVCGEAARDGFICARLKSRAIMKKFETKSEFFYISTF